MGSERYEVAVVGGGPGGYVAGIRLGQLGKKAVVIEREQLGGVCLNWGCIPSKALIHAANLVGEMHEFEPFGIKSGPIEIDAGKLMSWKDGILKKQRNGVKSLLESNKCAHVTGDAKITSPNAIELRPKNGDRRTIEFDQLIIASGARVIELPGFTFDPGGELIGYARHGVSYDPLPRDLVIIGGGVIGSELGMVYAKLGSKVTIVEMMPSILPGTDPDLVRPVLKKMKKIGIEVLTGAKAKGVDKNARPAKVQVETAEGAREIPADRILVAVGFRPNTTDLGLDAAGVKTDERGWIAVDEKCRTNVPHIYAIGDVTGAPLLAHRASKMGEVAAEVIAGHAGAAFDVRAMPLGIFTDPEIAQVGLTAEQAEKQGHEVAIGMFPVSALGKAAAMNATDGVVKVILDRKSDAILGVGVAAAGACDLIAEACLALEMGALAEDVGSTVHTHPTLSEGIMEAAKAARGEAVHMVNRPRRGTGGGARADKHT